MSGGLKQFRWNTREAGKLICCVALTLMTTQVNAVVLEFGSGKTMQGRILGFSDNGLKFQAGNYYVLQLDKIFRAKPDPGISQKEEKQQSSRLNRLFRVIDSEKHLRARFGKQIRKLLEEQDYITPLSTTGIISQLSESYVVYDAATAMGGSGGPVLTLEGQVIGVNAAVMREFGGSNLGVPVFQDMDFLSSF